MAPSGRLPSDRKSPTGSLVAGTCALIIIIIIIMAAKATRCRVRNTKDLANASHSREVSFVTERGRLKRQLTQEHVDVLVDVKQRHDVRRLHC